MGILKTVRALKIIANALVLHGFLCIVDFYTVQYRGFLYIILSLGICLAVSVLGELSVRKPKKNYASVCLSAGVALLSLTTAVFSVLPATNAVFAAAVFIWLLVYRHNKLNNKTGYAPRGFILMFIFMYVEGQSFQMYRLCSVSAVSGIAFLIITLFLSSVTAHEKFIKENYSVQNFPMEQIRKTYFSLLSVFCVVCLICSAAFSSVNPRLDFVGDAARGALRSVIENLPEAKVIKAKTISQQGKKKEGSFADGLSAIERKDGNQDMDKIVTVVSLVVLILGLLVILALFLRRITNTLKRTENVGADRLEFAYARDVRERAMPKSEAEENEPYDKKIRKMYKKYVLKATKKDVRKSDTAAVLEGRIKGEEEKKAIARAIYEKARYSKDACTSEDTERFRKSVK